MRALSLQQLDNTRAVLREELDRRCRRNPKYSLRAFARTTGVSHTVLSLVMTGKRPLSRKAGLQIADALSLDAHRRARLTGDETGIASAVAASATPDPELISLDQFALIADWYHLACLSLLGLSKARFEARWISARLGISQLQAQAAMDRLQRLGLVRRLRNGRWRPTDQPIRFDNLDSTAATRLYQLQVVELAARAIEQTPVAERDLSNSIVAVSPAQVPYARRRIQEFRRELARELEQGTGADSVYHLAVQFYPVTQPLPGSKKGVSS